MNEFNYEDWQSFYKDRVKGERGLQLVRGYLAHAASLSARNLPPIFEFSHLAALLGVSEVTLATICHSPHSYYRTFEIPKRTGGLREISVPRPILMKLQRWILANIVEFVEVHPSAHGFLKNRSIVTNAQQHLGCNELLKIDILNFFPSISSGKVRSLLAELGYSDPVASALTRVCTKNDGLPQGAPTSPALSNLAARAFDIRIADHCAEEGLIYTRYADDIAISGQRIDSSLRGKIIQILADANFKIHPVKSRLYGPNDRKIIAGISISSGKLMPPKAFVRSVRQDVFHVTTKGLIAHMAATENFDPLYLERLLGKIAFWKHVTKNSDQSLRAELALKRYMADSGLA
ncbi:MULTISPECIES: reverse transcriptase family protein [Pseudomonadota]|uniref:reverse transcriptase family protein n=1 Tax=Pseudomonadota TaxID=1224 RepID=UPI00124CD2BE|nr:MULTISPECIES: reverse transcriptase family protein [Pseudomonadota]KAB2707192.1 RNA-directed DNA polymerase [Brucella intermedia]MDQ4679397.1 reverse transcriptase family protein [Stenotrophomonas maltophilia group sp. RNC7]